MVNQHLNNGWQFTSGPALNRKAEATDIPDEKSEWFPIDVPGDVNVTLQQAGAVPDAHYDVQAQELYFVTAREWWYRKKFIPDRIIEGKTELVFEGLDGVCDVWLNNSLILHAESAFYPHRKEISDLLKPDGNTLVIRFFAIDNLLESERFSGQTGWGARRAFLRKPQYNFGWDWSIPVPSLGICGNVRLDFNEGRIENVGTETFTDGRIYFSFEVDAIAATDEYRLEAEVSGHGFYGKKTVTVKKKQKSYLNITVDNPKLWFPTGYGEQNLYDYSVKLIVQDEVKDSVSGKTGLREVRIIEEPFTEEAGEGYSFWISVNGMRTFCKGANWIPTELWPGAADNEKTVFGVGKAYEAGFNMLRVWGGGIYGNDCFYGECDKSGIMVWQDFMFASTGYPLPKLRNLIINEADYQIKRLRNHPSVVIWCGCNEDCYSWSDKSGDRASVQDDIIESATNDKWSVDRYRYDPELYTMLLRGLVGKYGNGVPYVESSPQSRDGAGNRRSSGNSHISCWKYALFETKGKYYDYRGHFGKVCSFDSEFCIQGPPTEAYIKSFLKEENHWPPNEAWIYHIQRGHRDLPHYEQTLRIAESTFGKIDSLQKYVKYGMTVHCEHMRSELDFARHDYPNNGGTMVWMLMDCWPTANWSIINYDKSVKPAFYAAKRGCAAQLPIIFERKGVIDFSVSNHSTVSINCKAKYGKAKLNGVICSEYTSEAVVSPFETHIFGEIRKDAFGCENDEYIYLSVISDGKVLDTVTYFPEYWKNVPFRPAKLIMKINETRRTGEKTETDIIIETDTYARTVHLYCDGTADTVFSDNYFDMVAASRKCVTITSDKEINVFDIHIGDWFSDFG